MIRFDSREVSLIRLNSPIIKKVIYHPAEKEDTGMPKISEYLLDATISQFKTELILHADLNPSVPLRIS